MKEKGAIPGRRAVVVGVLAIGLAALVGPAPAPAVEPRADASAQAKKKRGAKPVPKRALKALRALEGLEPRAERRWPGSFGGLWIEGGRVFVAFTDAAKKRVGKLGRKFPDPKRLRAVSVDDSLAALRQLLAQAISDRAQTPVSRTEPRSRRAIPIPYALEIDVKRNAVVALVHEPVTAEIAAAFAQRYGNAMLVEFLPPAIPHGLFVCTGRDNCPPNLRAGLLTHAYSGTSCTAAFNVTYPSGGTTVDGLLSAAHCGNPDADYLHPRSHAGHQYGVVVAEQQSGRVDAELHAVLGLIENSAPWSALAPWIWLSNAVSKAPVHHVGTYSSLPIGATVCKSGVMTEVTCGEVLSKTHSSTTYIPNAMDFIRADYCSIPGDSGAPVYTTFVPWIKLKFKLGRKSNGPTLISRKAQGIHSGGTDLPCSSPDRYAIFGHIEFAQDALNVTVATP